MFIAEFHNLDYEDYPIGRAVRCVGVWDTSKAAYEWMFSQPNDGSGWSVREIEKVN